MIKDDFQPLPFGYMPDYFYLFQINGVMLPKDENYFTMPNYIQLKIDSPWDTKFDLSGNTGMFNGYSQKLITRMGSTFEEEIIDPEISLSIYYEPTNTTRPFDKFTVKTVDDTVVYDIIIYPLTSNHTLQRYVKNVGFITSVLKIKDSPARATKLLFSIKAEPSLRLDDNYFKVGFKDNVTILMDIIPFKGGECEAIFLEIGSKMSSAFKSRYYFLNDPSPPPNYIKSPDIYDSMEMFELKYISNIEFNFYDMFTKYTMPFPFGVVSRPYHNAFLQIITVFIPSNVTNYGFGSIADSLKIYPYDNPFIDYYPPILLNIEIINFDYITNVIRINVTDQIGLGVLQSTNYLKLAKDALVEGTIQNGIFEFIVDIRDNSNNYFSFYLLDLNGNSRNYGDGYYNVYSSFPPSKILNFKLQDISYFDFKYHTMDTSESESINYLFFNLTGDFDRTMTPLLQINFKGSFSNQDFSFFQFTGYWDSNLEVFIIPFYLQKNFVNGFLEYNLVNSQTIYDIFLYPIFGPKSQVYLTTNKSDLLAPVISNYKIFVSNTVDGITTMGWTVTIIDEINGFSNGYFEVISNLDWVPMKLDINETNRIYGNSFNGTYNVVFSVILNTC
eukprot:gene12462-15225_t